jgi:hypothetical protein
MTNKRTMVEIERNVRAGSIKRRAKAALGWETGPNRRNPMPHRNNPVPNALARIQPLCSDKPLWAQKGQPCDRRADRAETGGGTGG